MITVERKDGDVIKQWSFRLSGSWGDLCMVLYRYMEGTRTTKRHKLRGDFWDSSDERSYHSKLPRPTSIPDDVIDEALSQMTIKVCVGFVRKELEVATRKVGRRNT